MSRSNQRTRKWRVLHGTLLLAAVAWAPEVADAQDRGLREERAEHRTRLVREVRDARPAPAPPAGLTSVRVPSSGQYLAGFLADVPASERQPDEKRAGLVWLIGGFPGGGYPSEGLRPGPLANDQTAAAHAAAGTVVLYPTLRGSYGNPGQQESFYGEVDDVLAALAYLRGLEHVDPERVFLGGHSTGGTLALLAAACDPDLAGVIAFGPMADPAEYGAQVLHYDIGDPRERRLRAPVHHLEGIRAPTLVIEGEHGNLRPMKELERVNENPLLRFFPVRGADHFEPLGPINKLIAPRLARGELSLTTDEVAAAQADAVRATREAEDLETLAELRGRGLDLSAERRVSFHLIGWSEESLAAGVRAAIELEPPWEAGKSTRHRSRNGLDYHACSLFLVTRLDRLEQVFARSRALQALELTHGIQYVGWEVE